MARYRLTRKTYSIVGDAAKNTIGGTSDTIGRVLDSKPAALAGGILGAAKLGGTIGSALTTATGTALGGPLGMLLGAGIGSALTRSIGRGLKNFGTDIQT